MMFAQLPEAEAIRSVFEGVLAGPDFEPVRTSLAARVVRWVWTTIDRLFGDLLPTLEEGPLEVLSLLLVTAAAVALVVTGWRRTVGRGVRVRRSQPEVVPTGPRGVADWVEWARGARGGGDLRLAATGLYQAVVLHLESRGALRYREWKTPGDYADEIEGRDEAVPFEAFLALFVEIAFGPREPTGDAVDTLFTRAERLGCPI